MPAPGRMRILICIDSLGLGGKERQAVELVKGLASQDICCHVVYFEASDFYFEDLVHTAARIDFLPRKFRWDLGVFRKLNRLIHEGRPQVIHANGLVSSFYCLPLAKLARIPFVNGSIRNAFRKDGLRWTLERLLLKYSDYRVANSRAGLTSRGFSATNPRNAVIYNGFDFDRVERLNAKSGESIVERPTGIRTVGMVAEFNRYKDYATFIAAARILGVRRPEIQFLAVGDGDKLAECTAAAADLSNITFLGRTKAVEETVATFDIGVLCSFVEGFSNSIMEYMALGKPVVATRGGGTSELVCDGETGILIGPTDPIALVRAIEYLVDNPQVAALMGRAGRTRLRNHFTLSQMVNDTKTLYLKAAIGLRPAARRVGLQM